MFILKISILYIFNDIIKIFIMEDQITIGFNVYIKDSTKHMNFEVLHSVKDYGTTRLIYIYIYIGIEFIF